MWWAPLAVAAPCELAEPGEPLTVHLVSIAPGGGLLDSMGHTVLAFSGAELEGPRAYNWGVYDSSQPEILSRFLRGQVQFYLVAHYWQPFFDAYSGMDRTMVGQRLALDPPAARELYEHTDAIAQGAERAYTYHWAEANCSTQARDALDAVLGGRLRAELDRPVDTTARHEGMRHFARWPVVGFTWDFLVSGQLDRPLTAWQRAMVPERLMEEVDGVQGLVAERCTFYEGRWGWAPERPLASWPFAVPGLVGSAALLALRAPRVRGALVLLYGVVLATLGTSTFALYQASALDGLGPTANWLLAGPQTWVLAWAGLELLRGRRPSRRVQELVWALGGLGLLALPAAVAGGQSVAGSVAALLPGLLASVVVVGRS
jgi:hypothetical protein